MGMQASPQAVAVYEFSLLKYVSLVRMVSPFVNLRIQDNDINRMILAKRLSLDGHDVVNTTNGQEGVEMIESDWDFDCILMDIQYVLCLSS